MYIRNILNICIAMYFVYSDYFVYFYMLNMCDICVFWLFVYKYIQNICIFLCGLPMIC